jgi:hypothetical protein
LLIVFLDITRYGILVVNNMIKNSVEKSLFNATDEINGFLKYRVGYQFVIENSGNAVNAKIVTGFTTLFAVRGNSIADAVIKLAKMIDER